METHIRWRLLYRWPLLVRMIAALLAAAAFQTTQPDGAAAESPDQRLVGVWLGLRGKYGFLGECQSGAPVRYTPDGMYAGPGARGIWQLRDGRLTETATEVDEDLDGDLAWIGKPYVSAIVWQGADTFVKTFSDDSRMTFRRCPASATPAAAPASQNAQHTRSKAADYLVREQIAEACADKTGTIAAASVIEQDLTGDGKPDLVISHEGISCAGDARSSLCGAAAY